MAVDVKLRYNVTEGEVELVYGESVAMTSGKDVFESWAKHWAESNDYIPKSEAHEHVDPAAPVEPKHEPPAEKPIEPVTPVTPQSEPVPEATATVETPAAEVDSPQDLTAPE